MNYHTHTMCHKRKAVEINWNPLNRERDIYEVQAKEKTLFHSHLPMASFTFSHLLISLILLLSIIDQIDTFHFDDPIRPSQTIEHHHNHRLRSVLWPKICMDLLKQRLGEQLNRHRLGRKCYPFDIQ